MRVKQDKPPTRVASSRRQVRREGLLWLVANLTIVRLGGTVATLVLRRLLGPAVSGVFDLALTPYRFFDSIRNFGVGPVLVYERRLTHDSADTAWTFNVLLALALVVVVNTSAHAVALFYGHPGIERLLRVLSIAYLAGAAGSVHGFLLLRFQDFRARAIPGIGQVVIGATVAVMAAVWSTGDTPLVLREVLTAAVGAALLWFVCPYRPHLHIASDLLRHQLRYSLWIGAGLSSLYIAQNADVFIAGHVIHRAADVGFYTTAWRLTFIIAGVIGITVTSVVFPALSRAGTNAPLFRLTLITAIRQSAFVVLPASLCLAGLAPVLIVPVLGDRWAGYRDDWGVLAIFALYSGARALTGIFFEGYKAVGRPWLLCAYNLVKASIIIPIMVLAAPHGIGAMAAVYTPILLFEVPLAVMLARRILQIALRDLWVAIRTSLGAALFTLGILVLAERWLQWGLRLGDAPTLLLCVTLAIVTYGCAIRVLEPRLLREARALLIEGLVPASESEVPAPSV